MKKIEQFQIIGMTISGFKSYEGPTELTFGNPTVITGGNGRGKTSIADAIAFVVTGLPFFGERGIDRLHNESNPDVAIQMYFVDETGAAHKLIRTRKKNRMTITYDGYEIRQLDLTDLFGERDVFLSILNPLYFIEELGEDGKNLLERYLPLIPQEMILAQLAEPVRASFYRRTPISSAGAKIFVVLRNASPTLADKGTLPPRRRSSSKRRGSSLPTSWTVSRQRSPRWRKSSLPVSTPPVCRSGS